MSEPLQYACDEHGWCDFRPCPKCVIAITNTPRTDAQYKEYARRDNDVKCVDIDFARQLERELAQAVRERGDAINIQHAEKKILLTEIEAHVKTKNERDKLAKERFKCICVFCKKEFAKDSPELPDHILSCEKSPLVKLVAEAKKLNEEIVAENDQLRKVCEHAKMLLSMAGCPNCDGSGGKQISETECEQCQWCDEKNKLLADFGK